MIVVAELSITNGIPPVSHEKGLSSGRKKDVWNANLAFDCVIDEGVCHVGWR